MDLSFSDLNFNSVETLPGYEARAAFTVSSAYRWFSRKYFASVMNIQEFYADSLGQEFCHAISNALNPDLMRRAVTR